MILECKNIIGKNRKRQPGRLILTAVMVCIAAVSAFAQTGKDYTRYVNPFIGTGGHGHTFPGATLPFGMVQLSPDTGVEGWDWCSGYHASDSSIMGFSHTHLSGTGGADYGDILLMPVVGKVKYIPGTKGNPDEGYRSRFRHETERATPGYYAVHLDDYNVEAELTATLRTGMHRYTFPGSSESSIVLDLKHGISDNVITSMVKVLTGTRVEGYRISRGWANEQRVYFAIEFSKPFAKAEIVKDSKVQEAVTTAEGKDVKASFGYFTTDKEQIMVKVALSSVSCSNAWANMKAENSGFDFEKIRTAAKEAWNKELAKIEVEGSNETDKIVFYSSLYHTKIHPNIFQDVNGEYLGMDMKVHKAEGRNHYTLFSLWDTFRALHPLMSITDPSYNNDFIKSMVAKYQEIGRLPVWELWSNETNTMIGYHSVPVIADAILKGYYTGDIQLAYKAMLASALADGQGLRDYKHFGYIPREKEANSVSKTLEYAFDDYAIAEVARKLGKSSDYNTFLQRSYSYKNVFDGQTRFMRGRDENGVWNPNFDPMSITLLGSGDFTEGNSWQYSFFAPHDMNGLISLYGGNKPFVAKLDEMFKQEAVNDNEHALDVTGLIGQYAHGNEPSHHVIYTYSFALRPDRTQELVRQVMHEMYRNERDGYSGNEDCGQMSAWYVFSAMGFYPMNPVGGQYVVGSPLFDKVTLHLENGKTFVLEASGNSADNKYIKSAVLNGKSYAHTFINHSDIMKGGKLVFTMAATPQSWGTSKEAAPVQWANSGAAVAKAAKPKVFMPYPVTPARIFKEKISVELKSETTGTQIFYTLGGTAPTRKSRRYQAPLMLEKSTVLKAIAVKSGYTDSDIKTVEFKKAYFNDGSSKYPVITSEAKTSAPYNPGLNTLIDGILGTNNFRDGRWTGVQDSLFTATIDLGEKSAVRNVTVGFMQNTGSWIFPPKAITVMGSDDGVTFSKLAAEQYELPKTHPEIQVIRKALKVAANVRYLKITIAGAGRLPAWHTGAGNRSYIFVDEITVE